MAAVTVYSAPDDGRKGRPKHVEHTCSFLINTILPELQLVGLLYIICEWFSEFSWRDNTITGWIPNCHIQNDPS